MPIRKRHDRWEVRLQIDGRRVEKTLPAGASRADALAVEASLRRSQIDAVVGRPERHSIADALDRWEQSGATTLRSWQRDMRYKAAIVRELAGDRDIDELPVLSEDIKRWGVEAQTSIVNINRDLAIVRRLGNLAERWGWTDKPLGRRVQLLPGERPRDMRLKPAQLRKLLGHADPRLADLVVFLTLTGLRRSEALRLSKEDIRGNAVHVDHRSKSGRPRVIPLAPEAAKTARKSIPFNLQAGNVTRMWNAARAAAGMKQVRLHDLRHAFGSWLIERGAALSVVRDLMGHSSLAVTSRYVQAAREGAIRAIGLLSARGWRGAGKRARRSRSERREAPKWLISLAEAVGFEPTMPLRACLISSQVHSTALPCLRSHAVQV